MGEVNLNQLTDLTANQKAGTGDFFSGQNTDTQNFLNRYRDIIANQGSTSALAGRIGAELGLPQLRQNAFNLQQQLTDIPNVYNKATQGYDVNANQLSRITNQKTSEIAPLAQRATEQQQFGEAELGRQLGYAQNDWVRELLPVQSEESFLRERQAREASMYTQQNQNELNALIAKLNAGITLSEGEKNRAHELSLQELKFEQYLQSPVAVGSDTTGFYTPGTNSFATGTDWS